MAHQGSFTWPDLYTRISQLKFSGIIFEVYIIIDNNRSDFSFYNC